LSYGRNLKNVTIILLIFGLFFEDSKNYGENRAQHTKGNIIYQQNVS